MSIHYICFCEEIRKISIPFGGKKKVPFLEICNLKHLVKIMYLFCQQNLLEGTACAVKLIHLFSLPLNHCPAE